MTVRDLLEVSPELKVRVRVVKDRKVKSNIIENQAPIALKALSKYYLDQKVKNVYIEAKNIFETSAFAGTKPLLLINIEE